MPPFVGRTWVRETEANAVDTFLGKEISHRAGRQQLLASASQMDMAHGTLLSQLVSTRKDGIMRRHSCRRYAQRPFESRRFRLPRAVQPAAEDPSSQSATSLSRRRGS